MKSFRLSASSETPRLIESDSPRPELGEGEVLVRIRAAGVTTSELTWYPNSHAKDGRKRVGAIPSHEFSGVIEAVSNGVSSFRVGQEIYGMNDWFEDGALAEYCKTRPEWIAPKPKTLSLTEAASVPIGALTAWQALFDHAKLKAGEKVLIQGGAGSVGSFAIQLAHSQHAYVATAVSGKNIEFARSLGAEQVIDYRTTRFETQLQEFDVVLDTVGAEIFERSRSVLKPGGRIVTVATMGEAAKSNERMKQAFFIVEPRQDQLVQISQMIDAGRLRTFVDAVQPLCEAPNVYAGNIVRSGRGKVVIAVP